MSFTSQHSSAGQQASMLCSRNWSALDAKSVKNWSPVSICQSPVGSRGRQNVLPGFMRQDVQCSSNPSVRMAAQFHVSMKNARKETGLPVSDKRWNNGPEAQAIPDDQIFATPPTPRQPESPEVESLRSLLKANLPREKASPALLQRIRSRMQED